MQEKLETIRQEAINAIKNSEDINSLEEVRIKYMGKKGKLTSLLRSMGSINPEQRPKIGKIANEIRDYLEEEINKQKEKLKKDIDLHKIKKEKIDVTLPGINLKRGSLHLITQMLNEIEDIFYSLGYSVAEGPEIEKDYFNFEALNIPKDHPARDMQDSFYITSDVLLRTHTSPVQVRIMENMVPQVPVKIIAPGKVYRRDDDATHSPMFHQVEGLVIDKKVTFGDLKGTLDCFAKSVFGSERETRFRPSYFPFTEPSAEVDISCVICYGEGCRVCSYTGWLEILGSGMVHPNVLRMSGYNPEEVSSFAFGMGVERIAMLKFGIDDLRLLFENDARFLEQF